MRRRVDSKASCLALSRIAFTRKALFWPSGTACSSAHAWRWSSFWRFGRNIKRGLLIPCPHRPTETQAVFNCPKIRSNPSAFTRSSSRTKTRHRLLAGREAMKVELSRPLAVSRSEMEARADTPLGGDVALDHRRAAAQHHHRVGLEVKSHFHGR